MLGISGRNGVGKALSAGDCLEKAKEYLAKAQVVEDASVRNEFLRLAEEFTEFAGMLDQDDKIADIWDAPGASAGWKKPGSGLNK